MKASTHQRNKQKAYQKACKASNKGKKSQIGQEGKSLSELGSSKSGSSKKPILEEPPRIVDGVLIEDTLEPQIQLSKNERLAGLVLVERQNEILEATQKA